MTTPTPSEATAAAAERVLAGRESAEYLMSDARLLARAYLAEHDPEPANILWLCELSREGGDMGFMKVLHKLDGIYLVIGEGESEVVAPRPATKGDVRTLARLAGITLKESK